jgi:hypothetical protein
MGSKSECTRSKAITLRIVRILLQNRPRIYADYHGSGRLLCGIDEQPPVTRIKRQQLFGLSQTNEET